MHMTAEYTLDPFSAQYAVTFSILTLIQKILLGLHQSGHARSVEFVRDKNEEVVTYKTLKVVRKAEDNADGEIITRPFGFRVMPKEIREYKELEDRLMNGIFNTGFMQRRFKD